MPFFIFPNNRIPEGYILPEVQIKLTEGMSNEDVKTYIDQELFKIYTNDKNHVIKCMMQEDLYDNIVALYPHFSIQY